MNDAVQKPSHDGEQGEERVEPDLYSACLEDYAWGFMFAKSPSRAGTKGGPRRLLALSVHPPSFAATRFRVSAYRPSLARANIELDEAPFLDAATVYELQGSRPTARAVRTLMTALAKRASLVGRRGSYDAVFVQREATMIGPPWLELALAKLGVPFVYDIDDAVWLVPTPVEGSLRARFPKLGAFVRAPDKGARLLAVATHVICGSERLAKHARTINPNVTVVPTVTDADVWRPLPCRMAGEFAQGTPVIGWIGTPSTATYLRMVEPALARLRSEGHDFRVRIRGAGPTKAFEALEHESLPWRQDHEIDDFAEIDIGVAPMKDDEWSAGKCAFKQIQYMAVGVPHVSSLAGAAAEVISGDNALVAHDSDDWYRMIKLLLTDQATRRSLATNGLRTVREKYSLQAQEPRFLNVIERAMGVAS